MAHALGTSDPALVFVTHTPTYLPPCLPACLPTYLITRFRYIAIAEAESILAGEQKGDGAVEVRCQGHLEHGQRVRYASTSTL